MIGSEKAGAASKNATVPPLLLSIQGLRALAALAVATYHALQWCDGGFDVGRAGVDVFFVISGVIMWHVTAGRSTSPGEFLLRRLVRVAPPYWIATLTVFVTALIWPAFLPEVRPGWDHLALSLAFIPHLDPRGLPFPTLPPGWSLNYEIVFYLIFAAALAGPAAWRGRMVVGALTAVTAIGFLKPEPLYFLGANPILLQFAAGLGLGLALEHRRLPGPALGVVLAGCGLGLLGAESALHLFTELWRPLLWGVPAVLIVAGGLSFEAGGGLRGLPTPVERAVRTAGDASYSLYLWHLPATALVAHSVGFERPWLFAPLAVAASIAAGLAGHRYIERPIARRWRRRVTAI
jgi:exopolysaccharide production protein ExoZ